MDTLRVGLLVGRERSFPDALIAEVNKRNAGVTAEYATVDITHVGEKVGYNVLIDRISHEVQCYQPYLKYAALQGTHVINNPFWRIADDKFFDTALSQILGVAVPKTVVLPNKDYAPDISSASLHNLKYPLSWDRMIDELGFPMFMKPHWGGGWRDVYRVESREELFRIFDRTGRLTMIAQECIEWTQYVRCIVIGRDNVRPALWDPRLSHFDRYVQAAQTMPALTPELEARVVRDAKTICHALGYDMNTVEFAIRDGVPYAIDMMNSAPDFDISSLGEEHLRWTVEQMADLVIRLARTPREPGRAAASMLSR